MENNQKEQEKAVTEVYDYTANLLVNEKKSSDEVVGLLSQKGISNENATHVVKEIEAQISAARIERANKDMLYGALWCAGGIIATVADIGFIFWGAILFGAIQFIKGAANA